MTERVYKTTVYLELSSTSNAYHPDTITGVKVAKMYQNRPVTPTGTIIKVNLEVPERMLQPEVTVKLTDGIADAIADLKQWTK